MEEYKVINNENVMQFKVSLNDEKATLTYRWYKKDMALMHTNLPEELAKKGIASAMVKYTLEHCKKTIFK